MTAGASRTHRVEIDIGLYGLAVREDLWGDTRHPMATLCYAAGFSLCHGLLIVLHAEQHCQSKESLAILAVLCDLPRHPDIISTSYPPSTVCSIYNETRYESKGKVDAVKM